MKHTLTALCTISALSLATLVGGCSSDPLKKVTEVMEAIAVEAEKSGGDCEKFAVAAAPLASKGAEAFASMKSMMESADKETAMKKFAEYAPRMAEVRKKLRAIKKSCRKHPAAKAVMMSLRGK